MTLVEIVPFVGIEKAGPSTPMAVSPDQRVLFVGVRSRPFAVISYAINSKSGKLRHFGNGPLADSIAYVATDPSGRFLFSDPMAATGSRGTSSPRSGTCLNWLEFVAFRN